MTVRQDGKQPRRDHYAVLGVESSASVEKITSAYRRLMRVLHPDVRPDGPGAKEQFSEVIDAYAVLRDPARRAAYDAERTRKSPLGGRPVAVTVTRAPAQPCTGGLPLHLTDVIVHVSAAPLEQVLLRVGPARHHPRRTRSTTGPSSTGPHTPVWL